MRRFDRTIGTVAFNGEIGYGDELLCDTPFKPLWHTLRDGKQKMVDTSLASDLIYGLHTSLFQVAIILGDDDDLLPPVFTASAGGYTVKLVRPEGRSLEKVTPLNVTEVIQFGM